MNNVWFTSDTHFNHANIMAYCERPFDRVEDMDEAIIENWNAVVKPGDRVYHLGDFGFGSFKIMDAIFKKLNGQKFLIIGNHDKKEVLGLDWIWKKQQYGVRVDEQYIWMNHFPMRSWNRSYHGSYHLFGHTHGQCKVYGKSFEVAVDAWDFKPVNFDTVHFIMKRLALRNPEFDVLFYQKPDQFDGTKLLETCQNEEKTL